MEPPPPFRAPQRQPPPLTLPAAIANLRSLLNAASSALAALPSPLLSHPINSTPSPPPSITTTTDTTAADPLPPPSSAVTLPLPLPAAPPPYSDCPAVVRVTPAPTPESCSLPTFLAAECADFSTSTTSPSPSPPPHILPSELAVLRRELDFWGAGGGGHHLPRSYSCAVTRVVSAFCLGMPLRWEAELRRWVLASSPRYGLVIDTTLLDHIWALVQLCLKAVAAEALCSLERARKGDEEHEGLNFDPWAVRFECPRLIDSISWLGAQLGVLYGEGNGRLLAIILVKEAVLRMGHCLVVVGGGDIGSGVESEASGVSGTGEKGSYAGDVVTGPIFLSQVATAIAALYDRLSMEKKTKAQQAPRPSKFQLLLEYSQTLEQGHLERSNRPNYRTVLEYDGILSRRADNQESGRAKTREELLAEERDYKRRRASYRGKKVKRNPTEILRDIIDEHMEEINQAGGISCLLEAPEHNMFQSNSHGCTSQGNIDLPSSSSFEKATSGSWMPGYENSSRANSMGRFPSRSCDTRDSYKKARYETSWKHHPDVSENENRWNNESEIDIDESYLQKQECNRHKRSFNDDRNYPYKKEVSDHRLESCDSTAVSTQSQRSSVTEYDHVSRTRSDRKNTSQKIHRSLSATRDQFSDRYDPKSTYADGDPLTSMLCDVPEGKHDIYHDEVHRSGHHERRLSHHR